MYASVIIARTARRMFFLNQDFIYAKKFRQGHQWGDLRSRVQKHVMRPRSVSAFIEPMDQVALDFQKRIEFLTSIGKFDITPELYRWALECKRCSRNCRTSNICWFLLSYANALKRQQY